MKTDTTKGTTEAAEGTLFLGADWFDPLEAGVRTRIRGFIENFWKRNSTLRWGGTGMNGLGLPRAAQAAGRLFRRRRPVTGTAIASAS